MALLNSFYFSNPALLTGGKGRGAIQKSSAPNVDIQTVRNITDNTIEYELVTTCAFGEGKPSSYPGQAEYRQRITGLVLDSIYGGKDVPSRHTPGGEVAAKLSGTKIQLIDSADVSFISEGSVVVLEPADGNMTNARLATVSTIDNASNAINLVGTNLTNATAGDYIKVYNLYDDSMGMAVDTLFQEGGLKWQLEKPFPPTTLAAEYENATTVSLTWVAPSCSNVLGYRIYYASGTNNPNYLANMTPALGSYIDKTTLNATIGNLTVDLTYTFVIVSINKSGSDNYMESRPSNIVSLNMTA